MLITDDEVKAAVTTTAPLIRTSGRQLLFRSQCPPDDIPDVARDVTWSDSFYQNDTDVIAAFDINHTMLDKKSMSRQSTCYFIIIIATLLIFLRWTSTVSGTSIDDPALFILQVSIGISLVLVPFLAFCIFDERRQNYRRRRTHVAIAQRGIYLDQVDEPGSRTLKSRTVASYDLIHECKVKIEEGCCKPKYEVVVYAVTNKSEPLFKVDGLVATQKFVDIVHAMKERYQRRNHSTSSDIPDNITTIDKELS
jgi:hypothetical protein